MKWSLTSYPARGRKKLIFGLLLFIAFFQIYLLFSPPFLRRRSEIENRVSRSVAEDPANETLRNQVSKSLGKVLAIEFIQNETNNGVSEDLTFSHVKANFWEKIDSKKTPAVDRAQKDAKGRKYVFVSGRYWEQLSMSMRAFLALVSQAYLGGRSVVLPRVKDSRLDTKGHPLGYYFDIGHMDYLLKTNGYPTTVEKEEFDRECSLNDLNYTTVHFLYSNEKAAMYTKNKFQLNNKQYDEISKKAKRKGWTECSFISRLTKQNPKSKMFCVDATVMTDWKVLERDVLRSAKCLNIMLWRGIGDSYRTRFTEKLLRISSKDIFFALKPSLTITTEARRFREAYLSRGYVAVHIRGERIAISHGLKQMKKCIVLGNEVIRLLKRSAQVDTLFVATDMSKYGSASWKDSVKTETAIEDNMLQDLQDFTTSTMGGILYEPPAGHGISDRGVIALADMSLLAQARSLVTIGSGSFSEWIVSKFLEFHQDDSQALWSVVRICHSPEL